MWAWDGFESPYRWCAQTNERLAVANTGAGSRINCVYSICEMCVCHMDGSPRLECSAFNIILFRLVPLFTCKFQLFCFSRPIFDMLPIPSFRSFVRSSIHLYHVTVSDFFGISISFHLSNANEKALLTNNECPKVKCELYAKLLLAFHFDRVHTHQIRINLV